MITLLVVFLVVLQTVSALEYEEKPEIVVSGIYVLDPLTKQPVSTNHIKRGDNVIVVISVYNDARREEVKYDTTEEAMFFSRDENMLFTAYNVKFELEGNEYIEVKTPEIELPALPPMQPVTLQFMLKVDDDAVTGEHELSLKVTYNIIDSLEKFEPLYNPNPLLYDPLDPTRSPIPAFPTQISITGGDVPNATLTYEYKQLAKEYSLEYQEETDSIDIGVYVEKKDVELRIIDVRTENLIAKGKGKIEVEVTNVGEKTAKNAYISLEVPTGFEVSPVSSTPMMGIQAGMVPPASQGMYPMYPSASMPSMTSIPSAPSLAGASYYVGDLKPGDKAKAIFYLKVNVKDEGNYTLKLKASYLDEYGNLKSTDSVPFGVYVAPAPSIYVENVKSNVFVNAKGDVTVTLKPSQDMSDVSVLLTANPPLTVLSSEYYLGDIKAGEVYTTSFKIKASDEAKAVTYPAQLYLKYKSYDEYIQSDPVRIGITVNPKMTFAVSGTPKIPAGQTKIVNFTITNTGQFTIHEATARLSIIDPFTSADDTAYIGTLAPGQSAVVKFQIKAESDATPKVYGLNLEVKYKDPEGEWVISEPVKATIEVVQPQIPKTALAILLIIVLVGIAIAIWRRRR
jgi:hypothetical protein